MGEKLKKLKYPWPKLTLPIPKKMEVKIATRMILHYQDTFLNLAAACSRPILRRGWPCLTISSSIKLNAPHLEIANARCRSVLPLTVKFMLPFMEPPEFTPLPFAQPQDRQRKHKQAQRVWLGDLRKQRKGLQSNQRRVFCSSTSDKASPDLKRIRFAVATEAQ